MSKTAPKHSLTITKVLNLLQPTLSRYKYEHTTDIHSCKSSSITSLCVYKQRQLDKSYCAQSYVASSPLLYSTAIEIELTCLLPPSFSITPRSFKVLFFSAYSASALRFGFERFPAAFGLQYPYDINFTIWFRALSHAHITNMKGKIHSKSTLRFRLERFPQF